MVHSCVLTLSCQDQPGIGHAVSGFLLERGGNIEETARYNDHGTGRFFMRVQFSCTPLTLEDLRPQLGKFVQPFGLERGPHPLAEAKRLEVMRSEGAELVVPARCMQSVLLNGRKTVVFQ